MHAQRAPSAPVCPRIARAGVAGSYPRGSGAPSKSCKLNFYGFELKMLPSVTFYALSNGVNEIFIYLQPFLRSTVCKEDIFSIFDYIVSERKSYNSSYNH